MRSVVFDTIHAFDESAVREAFSRQTFSRGKDYQQRGAVLELSVNFDRNKLVGIVAGSKKQPYQVEVEFEECEDHYHLRATDCSCPVGWFCKHAVALLLESISTLTSSNSKSKDALGLPGDLKYWLTGLQTLSQESKSSQDAVIYILCATRGSTTLPLLDAEVRLARLLQKGGYGVANRKTSFDKLVAQYSANGPNSDDAAISRLALAARGSVRELYGETKFKDPEISKQLILRMLDTGRCYWRAQGRTALKAGSEKKGELIWSVDSKGNQRPTVVIKGEQCDVLLAAGLWYVDTSRGQMGSVDVGLPFAALKHVLDAPLLSPQHAHELHNQLKSLPSSINVPLPRLLEEEVRSTPPAVCLDLTGTQTSPSPLASRGFSGKENAGGTVNFAVLSFDYGGAVFNLENKSTELRKVENDKIVVTKRDLKLEESSCNRLTACGFRRVQNWFPLRDHLPFSLSSNSILDWLRFMHSELPVLKAEGWRINIDESFKLEIVEAEGEWTAEITESDSFWFSLELGIEFEGKRLSLLPILTAALREFHHGVTPDDIDKLAISGKFFAPLPDGRIMSLPFERVKAILQTVVELFNPDLPLTERKAHISLADAVNLLTLEQRSFINWIGGERLKRIAKRLAEFEGVKPIDTPRGFRSELRPYQMYGVGWLQYLREFELGGILADDMGLGKTVQTLAHLVIEKQNGRLDKPALVVCPTSVVPNWLSEAQRLSPELRVLSLHGIDRQARFSQISKSDLVVTTYTLLPRDIEKLKAGEWSAVILDEAQSIKNDETNAARAACELTARYRLCLTGTPVENHLGELWSQFTFLMSGLLYDKETFKRKFRTPIEKFSDSQRLEQLTRRIRPFMLRRRKSEVAKDLPEKTVMIRHVELEGDQRDLYETVRLAMHEKVRKEVESKGFKRSQIVILDALLKLRQVCCDPRLVKLEAARKVLNSAKLAELTGMLAQLIEEGRKILLFSQFTSMLDLIVPELEKRGIPFVSLRGDTQNRELPVKQFQRGDVPLFLISLKAGGKGLNLTAADTVIHYDPWWNPAVEDQATDRAHRIGQDKSVFVYKFIATDTVEERMLELQEKKRKIADAVLDGENSRAPLFDESDLAFLLAPLPSQPSSSASGSGPKRAKNAGGYQSSKVVSMDERRRTGGSNGNKLAQTSPGRKSIAFEDSLIGVNNTKGIHTVSIVDVGGEESTHPDLGLELEKTQKDEDINDPFLKALAAQGVSLKEIMSALKK